MTTPDEDDDLLSRLRAADPVRDLEALPDDRILRMINAATASNPQPASSPARSPRRPLLIGLTGATGLAAVAFAAVAVFSPTTASATRLVMPDDPGLAAGSCPALDVEQLKSSPLTMAFSGRVTAVQGSEATLEVTEVFTGDPGRQVVVERTTAESGDYSGFDLVQGQDYLISTVEAGQPDAAAEIALCGVSGPASSELRAIYEAAFG
ncbi:MAG: hypothetical protein VB093_19755 [Propionicimonas sp.]|nr:hypothetical protein [Propionicimonas sp.]